MSDNGKYLHNLLVGIIVVFVTALLILVGTLTKKVAEHEKILVKIQQTLQTK